MVSTPNVKSLTQELLIDPYKRLKWGFIPVRRIVEDDEEDVPEIANTAESDAGLSVTTGSELVESGKKSSQSDTFEVTSDDDTEYEYRDEANRKWWKFFDEQEYRINKKQNDNWKWYNWFAPDMSTQEKKLLLKLDVLLAFYSMIAYWVKYLDTVNLNNAYVSGMKEEIGFKVTIW